MSVTKQVISNFENRNEFLKLLKLNPGLVIVKLGASWCGPCKKLDYDTLCQVAQQRGLTLWKCDETLNNYTSGYCGVRSFPTFVFFTPKTVSSIYKSNITEEVAEWINTL